MEKYLKYYQNGYSQAEIQKRKLGNETKGIKKINNGNYTSFEF